jgi:hypothetical protein
MVKAIRWDQAQLDAFEQKKSANNLQRQDAARRQFQALGRLKDGQMNKSESAYAALLEARKRIGEVLWYRFEGVKLMLAKNTSITVDFFVMLASGELQAHDVKGSRAIMTDDAWAKLKIAAEQYPFRFFACFPKKEKDGGGWDIQEI